MWWHREEGGSLSFFWWFIIVITTVIVVRHMLDLCEPITTGEFIIILITIPSIAVVLIRWIYRRIKPFKMRFSEDEIVYDQSSGRERIQSREKEIAIGNTNLLLSIKPKSAVRFEEINLRFVNRICGFRWQGWYPKLWRFAPVPILPKCKIRITHAFDARRESKRLSELPELKCVQDNTNGIDGWYTKPYLRTSEDSIFIQIAVEANEAWGGYLEFMSRWGESRRGYARSKVRVVEGATEGQAE